MRNRNRSPFLAVLCALLVAALPFLVAGTPNEAGYPAPGSAPRRLATFAEVFDAMSSGQEVRVVIQYAKCKLMVDGKEEKIPEATGGMVFTSWEQFAKGAVRNEKAYLSSSQTTLISHPGYGYVWNYFRIRLYEDGKVELNARYVKPTTLETVMDQTYTGALSDGKDKNGVSCFATGG